MVGALLDKTIVFSFDRTGYKRHARDFDAHDLDVDLSGSTALVTGASSGLGIAVTEGLVSRGATVRMLCRNVSKGERVRESLSHPARASVEPIDLSDFDSVRDYAARAEDTVDILVHNAGVLVDARAGTVDGHELTLATNYLGPLLLTHELWPRLRDDARIIHVSSGGMYSERLDTDALFEPPEPFDGVQAYARTKRAQVVIAEMLAQRSSRAVSSMHPGWADTPGVERSLPRFYKMTKPILRTPEQGADTIVWLAASPAAAHPQGGFYFDRARRDPHLSAKTRETPSERERLWSRSCAAIGADPEGAFR